ncbi:hypothetical protein KY289_019990 [Solanum tuberosum]|nr:hypothetical protein KY289_019990 [Solanum tuberosum]
MVLLSLNPNTFMILSELDMQDCKGVLTPMCSGKLPRAADGSPSAHATLYRRTLGNELVIQRQQVVARSSNEAEYKSVANALAEHIWVRNLLNELLITIPNTPTIFCDNVGVTYLYHNPVFHSRMKHIAVDFCYATNQVQAHHVLVTHTHACDQLADTFTKPLPKPAFGRCHSKLGIVALHLT